MRTALAHAAVDIDPAVARRKVAEYVRAVRDRHHQEDVAILRGYRELAKGHRVVDLPSVIRNGGVFDDTGLPRLAVATADHEFVHVTQQSDGAVAFHPDFPAGVYLHNRVKDVYRCPAGTLPEREVSWRLHRGDMRAMVPHVPPALRPVHKLSGYAVLFEVEQWARAPRPPGDPALLKHIGGDLYAVLATWDLTKLEQSVLMGRIR